jgi:hypothetical protein
MLFRERPLRKAHKLIFFVISPGTCVRGKCVAKMTDFLYFFFVFIVARFSFTRNFTIFVINS